MKASDILLKKIIEFEGCRLSAYQDTKGVWTIGVGRTCGVKRGDKITAEQAKSFLRSDLSEMEGYVNHLGVTQTQGQFDALTDFVYNVGIGNLRKSQLLQDIIHKSDKAKIEADFMAYNKSGGKVEGGLVTRRQWEAKRFFE